MGNSVRRGAGSDLETGSEQGRHSESKVRGTRLTALDDSPRLRHTNSCTQLVSKPCAQTTPKGAVQHLRAYASRASLP